MKNKILTKNSEIEVFLKSIRFDERLKKGEYFSNKEFRELLIESLGEYFNGQRSQEFVIELGAVFYPEVMTSVCMLNDLSYGYKAPETKKGKDKALLSVLKLLRESKQ